VTVGRFCPSCGDMRVEGTRFCVGCGADLGASGGTADPVSLATPPEMLPFDQVTSSAPSEPHAPPAAATAGPSTAPGGPHRRPLVIATAIVLLLAGGISAGLFALSGVGTPGATASGGPTVTPSLAEASRVPTAGSSPDNSLARALPSGWTVEPSAATNGIVDGIAPGALAFRSADGALLAYPPSTASPGPDWQLVSSRTDSYTLLVPPGWVVESDSLDGHDRFTLVPPGVDPTAVVAGGSPLITVAWSAPAPVFDPGSGLVIRLTDATVPVPGTRRYTFGGIEFAAVAAIPDRSGWVVVMGTAATDELLNDWSVLVASWKGS